MQTQADKDSHWDNSVWCKEYKKVLCFVDCASLYNLVNKTNLVHNLFLVYFVNLYVFRSSLGPSSGGTTVYRVSQEECARRREGVPCVKVYRYNPKHLCPKLNGYGDNGQRKVWSSGGSTDCTCQLTSLIAVCP